MMNYSFLARPEVEWKSPWRREFERRSEEEAAARRANPQLKRIEQKRVKVAPRQRTYAHGPRRRATLETNPMCPVAGCGKPTRLTGGPCCYCVQKARRTARLRFCARGCGRMLRRAGELCSTCCRLPVGLPERRTLCVAGCGRLLRRDSLRDVCKPCFQSRQADNPKAHPVACSTGCGQATRNPDRICWRCVKRPGRRLRHCMQRNGECQ